MNRSQWVLIITFAATVYGVGNIWMTELGWRLWPYVAPSDFVAYHKAWWAMIKPVVFPVAAVAFFGAIALIWWRPVGVSSAAAWLNAAIQVLIYALTAIFWGRWQAQTQYATLPGGGLDPMYLRGMSTHWIRAVLITLSGVTVLWMLVQDLSRNIQRVP
jgi:hypothetical protein